MANYFSEGFRPAARVIAVEKAIHDLIDVDYDTIVCRGTSGAAIAPIVAYLTGKKIMFVRKTTEGSHSGSILAGEMGKKFVIIDDFVETGATVQTILEILRDNTKGECVGFYGYAAGWIEDTSAAEPCEYFKGKVAKLTVPNLTKPETQEWQKAYGKAKYGD